MKKIIFVLGTLALFTLFFACKVEDAGAAADTKKYTVTIETNGGDGISDKAPMVEEGGTLTLTNPSKTGYVFKGWSTTNKLDNLDFKSGNSIVDHDITIYAVFVKLVTLTINANGGVLNTQPKTVEVGTSVTITDTPTRVAYTFSGYKDGNNNAVELNKAFALNDDMTVTAQWTVDLAAIVDILTGGTTNGIIWYNVVADSETVFFKQLVPNTPSLTIGCDWVGWGGHSPNNSTTTISVSDNPNYIAKISPGLTSQFFNSNLDYIINISSVSNGIYQIDLHKSNDSILSYRNR